MADIDQVIADAKELSTELLQASLDLVSDANQIAASRSFVNVREIDWALEVGEDLDTIQDIMETEAPDDFENDFLLPEKSETADPVQFEDNYRPEIPDIPDAPNELDTSGLFSTPLPSWNIGDFNEPTPDVGNVALPDTVEIDLPEQPDDSGSSILVPEVVAPTFDDEMAAHDIAVVDVTGTIADEFEATKTELADVADSYASAWLTRYCPEYDASMAELEDRISRAMAGGNAVDEEWEEAIYDRANVRVNDQQHIAQAALTADYARRGFPIPPGAVMSGLSRIRHENDRNLADVSGNIANERAKIELQHLQYGMQISATLRQHFSSAMQNYMQLVYTANGQALEYAKEIGKWAAELFNQRIQLYQLEQQRYRAEAEVYTVKLESAFAIIKQFEVQIEAEKLKIDLDKNQIELYEAKIRGELAKVEVYNAQLQGSRILIEAEGQKIDIYESQVRAYAARVNGKEGEYNAYRAAIQGDTAKVDAYRSEVQAYGSRVSAIGTGVDAERAVSQTIIESNRNLIAQRDSAIRQYELDLRGEETRFKTSSESYRLALAQYTNDVENRLKIVAQRYAGSRLELQDAIARVETNLSAQTANVNGFIKSVGAQAQITQAGGKILGDMAGSALTTNNTMLTKEE